MGLRKGVYMGFYAPAELKRVLQERATKEHRSLSQECIHILEAAVKTRRPEVAMPARPSVEEEEARQ